MTNPEFASLDSEDLLRAAIQYEREQFPETADFAVGQMYASVRGVARLEAVWEEETAPEQVEMDLHLTGESVKDHSARADQFAVFISGINNTTKAIVRERLRLPSLDRNLQVVGVYPGSVRVILRAEDATDKMNSTTAIPRTERFGTSPDSEALRTVGRLLTSASEPEPELAADFRRLPEKARTALRRTVKAVALADWEVTGSLRQRGLGSADVRLTQGGAAVLARELDQHQYTTEQLWVVGTIDGFRRSLGSFYLTPAGGQRPFAISVADHDVLTRAALLAAEEGKVVRAHIEVVHATDRLDSDRTSTSRLLLDIAESPQQTEITETPGA